MEWPWRSGEKKRKSRVLLGRLELFLFQLFNRTSCIFRVGALLFLSSVLIFAYSFLIHETHSHTGWSSSILFDCVNKLSSTWENLWVLYTCQIHSHFSLLAQNLLKEMTVVGNHNGWLHRLHVCTITKMRGPYTKDTAIAWCTALGPIVGIIGYALQYFCRWSHMR